MEEISAELLAEFPERGNLVFFDHAAVSPVTRRAKMAAQGFLDRISDPARINCPEFAEEVEKARQACAGLINATPENLCFVRSTSHGISLVASGMKWKTGENIVTYNREFPANIYPWMNLIKRGVEVRMVREREGKVPVEDIDRLINSQTRLVAVSMVQFTNGFRIDLKRLGEVCRKRGVLLLVDAIQALGMIPFDLKETPVDFLAADGHKWLLSFEGLGIFYINPSLLNNLDLNIVGWNSVANAQEYLNYKLELRPDARRFEEGSSNVISILGLGASASLFSAAGVGKLFSRALEITNVIADELVKTGSKIISPMEPECRSAILSVIPPNADLQGVNQKLRERGVVCSVRAGAIRLSPHGYQDLSDAEKFLQAWKEAVA
jgi:cysteine desulfurase / selenocysteine lyase